MFDSLDGPAFGKLAVFALFFVDSFELTDGPVSAADVNVGLVLLRSFSLERSHASELNILLFEHPLRLLVI